ncbi:MAG: WD40 repeat domain-containing protein, partial [Verrucomicrobia bacterium]|nr:WD40 repeat domain-containing protein [Verrucomicrobiota bacterium]
WDASTRTRIGEPEVALGGIERLEFNPARSASLVLMMKNRTVVMWDCASNSAFFDAPSHGEALDIGRFSIGRITSFSHSADGMWLGTTGNDGTARVWRPDMSPFGHPVMRHEGGEASCTLWCLSFDQSGTRVATGGANGQACVWDLAANIGLAEPALPAEVSVLKDKLSPLARHEGRVVDTKDEQLMVTGEDGLSMSGLLGFEADGAVFASDGNRVLLRTGDDHNWNDVPFVRAPEWIHSFTTAICGARYLDGGKLKLESLAARLDELEKVKAAINDKDDSWAKLARWTITSASARTVSPLAKLTTGEIAKGLFDALDGTANANADKVMRAVIEAQCHVPDHPLVALTQALLHPEERSTTLLRIGLRRLVTWVASGTLERRTAGTILSKIEAAWPGQLQSSQLRLLALTDTEAQQILALLPPGK